MARRLRTENKDMLAAIAKDFDREVAIESVSDFHIHDVKMLSAKSRQEVSAK